jgi:hypothetical protein
MGGGPLGAASLLVLLFDEADESAGGGVPELGVVEEGGGV